MYYGTEILMKNFKDPTDAEVRKDFPGGWPSGAANKFAAAGRTPRENEAFDFVKNWPPTAAPTPRCTLRPAHTVPAAGRPLRVFPLRHATGTVLVVTNATGKPATLPTARFVERMAGFSKARNVLTGQTMSSISTLALPAKTAVVLELLK